MVESSSPRTTTRTSTPSHKNEKVHSRIRNDRNSHSSSAKKNCHKLHTSGDELSFKTAMQLVVSDSLGKLTRTASLYGYIMVHNIA